MRVLQVGIGSLNHETGGAPLEVRVQGVTQCFDVRALAIVDEAVAMGVLANLPVFRSTEAELCIDLRSMPAAVAEVGVTCKFLLQPTQSAILSGMLLPGFDALGSCLVAVTASSVSCS